MSNSENTITNKIYRYESLLQAIDFFTQRFGIEQLSNFAFEFCNEVLTLNSTALFIKNKDEYILNNIRNYKHNNYKIKNSKKLKSIPTFHGNLITNNFNRFFDKQTIEAFNISLVIPLIIDDYLHGFLISDGKAIGTFDESDFAIAQTLMRLFNNSLENSKIFSQLKSKNEELDQKIFNLFAINQSAKTLLSQINLKNLYSIATDIFSEMTGSKVTSFGIFDENSNNIQIKGYRNISDFSSFYTEFELYSKNYNDSKIVLNIEDDIDTIKSLFKNWKDFYNLQTKFIILIVKDEILGLVTLSDSVKDSVYEDSVFELVQTLASFTYIALSNAIYFKKINAQKAIIEKKFKTLVNLNKLVRNINECTSIEELCELTLRVLNLSFNVKKSFITLKSNDCYFIKDSVGINFDDRVFDINDKWSDTLFGETIYDFRADSYKSFFPKNIQQNIASSNCTLISPISIEKTSYDLNSKPLGYLVILETDNSLQEEEILLIDTITNNISPIIYQMQLNKKIKSIYKEDTRKNFLTELKNKINEMKEYNIVFNIYYKKINKHPFKKTNLDDFKDFQHYLIDDFLFIISYDELSEQDLIKIPTPNTVQEFIKYKF